MATVLVGIKSGTSKKGNPYTMIHIVQDYSEVDKANGAYGSCVESVFLPDVLAKQVSPSDIGKKINIGYSVFAGRANVASIEIVGK